MKFLLGFLIVFLLILGYLIVQLTGGTEYAYLHILYIPVILSGFVFSLPGGVAAGLIAGLLMSPFMPSEYAYEHTQPFSSWALRMFIYTLVGVISGVGASIFKAYIKELELKQITDALTGLPNHQGLAKIFSETAQTTDNTFTIVVVELNQIQKISAAVGEEGTSHLTKQVAESLRQAVGNNGILGRLQAHSFAILIPDQEKAQEVLRKFNSLSEITYLVNNIPLFVEMRFGISQYPDDDKDLNQLIRKAQLAIKTNQNQTEQVSRFDKSVSDSSERNLMILNSFKTAIDTHSLVLEYQPKAYLKTGKVMGFEALVRWSDPVLGSINPMDFVPLIEETLLITPFTRWVLETALSQMHQWKVEGILVPVSVNFSIKNFHDTSMLETLEKLLENYKIPPRYLEVEVTETSVATSISTIASALGNLREVGISIAIDDFGTGQASQQYLFELPINTVKIDKLFVQSIAHNPAAAAIVKNAITLAHELNLEVIAEGVETHNQYDILKKWKCDAGQGYLIGRSMKADEATKWLKKMLKPTKPKGNKKS
ncbi:MAG TPA: bifunctional diguanylate cyclase/phosphodiesterase [Alphaproteobacteria bacterium]|nr:bifunctional diguanylate cyclase/phosphodiesterase [Alphaproteobacteria bacterium]